MNHETVIKALEHMPIVPYPFLLELQITLQCGQKLQVTWAASKGYIDSRIPACDTWDFRNKRDLAELKRGLCDVIDTLSERILDTSIEGKESDGARGKG